MHRIAVCILLVSAVVFSQTTPPKKRRASPHRSHHAMAADGLSTAAMVLGREQGLRFLEQQGVGGLLIASDGSQCTTEGSFGLDGPEEVQIATG